MIAAFIVTAYCLTGIMANGQKVHEGSIACPRRYKLGTEMVILGKTRQCHDRLGKKYDNRIDIWMPKCSNAINFGKQKLKVIVK